MQTTSKLATTLPDDANDASVDKGLESNGSVSALAITPSRPTHKRQDSHSQYVQTDHVTEPSEQ